jgi:putative ABC transport system permease protein
MFINHLKIALRKLLRNKGFSAINILGLSIGIATCLLISLYINNELGYDRYNEKAGRMVSVFFQGNVQGQRMNEGTVMPPVARQLKADFPEVAEAVRLRDYGHPKLLHNGNEFQSQAFAYVDSNFFEVFTLPLLAGNAKTVLAEPNSIVITKEVARTFFGVADPIGQTIRFKEGDGRSFKVTGIINQMPENANFHFDLFASMSSLPEARENSWMVSNYNTFLVLKEGYDYKKLETKLPMVIERYLGPQMQKAMGVSLTEFRKKGNDLSLHLKPITEIHLDPGYPNNLGVAGNIQNIFIFGAIAIFMLLIACINFMNLSTASASKRTMEVSIRKVMGSSRNELVRQFLLESVIISCIALIIGLVMVYWALPFFNRLAGLQLSLSFSFQFIMAMLFCVVITGILAGSYPAFYLSSFKPVSILKSNFLNGNKGGGLRKGLVVFQFFISIVLITGTTVVFKQLAYMRNKDMGYHKENVLIIEGIHSLGHNGEIFRQSLLNDPRIASLSSSGYLPAGPSNNNNFFVSPENRPDDMVKTLRYDVDENYIQTLGIKLAMGRNFSTELHTDSFAVILNETATKVFGWGSNALGRTITNVNNAGVPQKYTVIGVVKDFNFRSLHESISPLVMTLAPDHSVLIAKLNTTNPADLTASLAKRWVAYGAKDAFSYSFLDDRLASTYRSERRTGEILGIFATLTILVACLGLFGLAMFTAQQRKKEIGIRKVLGASIGQVTGMLSKEFIWLVLIACMLAFPIAYWAMHQWLNNFVYRTGISWWVFAFSGTGALVIALLTISFQAIKAALANPVESLRVNG